MTQPDAFEQVAKRLCQERGWGLGANRFEVPFASGRRQEVHFALFDFEDQRRVRLHSRIGSTRAIAPARLQHGLDLNFGLPWGALAVRDDELVLVETLAVGDDAPEQLGACVAYLAETADRLERTMFGTDAG